GSDRRREPAHAHQAGHRAAHLRRNGGGRGRAGGRAQVYLRRLEDSGRRVLMETLMLSKKVQIQNKRGLHARASAKFVTLASRFDANVRVSKDGAEVTGTSIMGLMMLAAAIGEEITINASGPQAQEALEALVALVEARFDEE